ncbi:hypothetical protein ACJ8MF_02290 [Bifidobacterium adolescentis]|uniref:hypothetical protein n=1 Tax=Bifidobacterium adolescentis TaxID=1680 RepID=UPI003B9D8AFC
MKCVHHILAIFLTCVGVLYAVSGFIFDYLHPEQISSFPSYLYFLRAIPFIAIAIVIEIFLVLRERTNEKLKLLASIVTAVMLVGSITSNASATETKETSYVNTTISSFPTDASLADFAEAFSGDDLEIVSSPLRNVDYQTRAAESVALLRIYSTTGSGSSSSSSNLGHSWLTITNLSGSTTNIAGLNVADGKSVTASTWDESVSLSSEHEGLWLNLDSKINSMGSNLQNVSIQIPLRQIDLDTVNTNIANNDKWGLLNNCSSFASRIWNSVSADNTKVDAGIINMPANLEKVL